MDWMRIALAAIVAIGALEGLYLLLKSRREKLFKDGEVIEERVIRIKVWEALKLGLGFSLGMLLFLVIMAIIVFLLKESGLAVPALSLSSPV